MVRVPWTPYWTFLMTIATKCAIQSSCAFRHGAVLFAKNKIYATGCNKSGNHVLGYEVPSVHAESQCLETYWGRQTKWREKGPWAFGGSNQSIGSMEKFPTVLHVYLSPSKISCSTRLFFSQQSNCADAMDRRIRASCTESFVLDLRPQVTSISSTHSPIGRQRSGRRNGEFTRLGGLLNFFFQVFEFVFELPRHFQPLSVHLVSPMVH